MFGPTHLMLGVVCQRVVEACCNRPKPVVSRNRFPGFIKKVYIGFWILFLGTASHWLADAFNFPSDWSKIWMYHEPLRSVWQMAAIAITGLMVLIFLRRYWLGMLFAVWPDFEWVFINWLGLIPRSSALHHKWHSSQVYNLLAGDWGIIIQNTLVLMLIFAIFADPHLTVKTEIKSTLNSLKRLIRR